MNQEAAPESAAADAASAAVFFRASFVAIFARKPITIFRASSVPLWASGGTREGVSPVPGEELAAKPAAAQARSRSTGGAFDVVATPELQKKSRAWHLIRHARKKSLVV